MTRNFARLIPVLALVLSLSAFAQTGSAAAPAGQGKIGIINIQGAIVASNEGQRDFQSLQKKFDPKRVELENLNKDVDELTKRLNTQSDKLNEEARAQLARELDTKKKTLQRNYEDANNDVQGQQNEIANRIGQKMMEAVDKYAKANGYAVILDISGQGSPVLWAGESTDITPAIVEAYNASSGVPAQPKAAGAPAAPSNTRPAATTPKPAAPAVPKPTTPKK